MWWILWQESWTRSWHCVLNIKLRRCEGNVNENFLVKISTNKSGCLHRIFKHNFTSIWAWLIQLNWLCFVGFYWQFQEQSRFFFSNISWKPYKVCIFEVLIIGYPQDQPRALMFKRTFNVGISRAMFCNSVAIRCAYISGNHVTFY